MEKKLLINPRIRIASPSQEEASKVKYLEGSGYVWTRIPEVGDLLNLPFTVDPQTCIPVALRVLEILDRLTDTGSELAIVVRREDQPG